MASCLSGHAGGATSPAAGQLALLRPNLMSADSCARAPGQDNEPLMRALSALINLSAPDLVLFVGEALVGNDTVDPLTHSDPF